MTSKGSWARCPTEEDRRAGGTGLAGYRKGARYYTDDEDAAIIHFIVEKGRKAISLKERFLRNLVHNLHRFKFLSTEQQDKLRSGAKPDPRRMG